MTRHYARFRRHPAPVQAVPKYALDREEPLIARRDLVVAVAYLTAALLLGYLALLGCADVEAGL